jgi:hypothetical protein
MTHESQIDLHNGALKSIFANKIIYLFLSSILGFDPLD